MALIADLLQSVTAAKSAEDYWTVQNTLAAAIETRERIIRRKEQRHLTFRNAIKQCAEQSAGNPGSHRERLQRLQNLLAANQRSNDDHRFARGAILYLGDTLAYNLMPDHEVRLHGRNSSPGFFEGKQGREQELEIGAWLTKDGWTVLLHDLTHCLRIGDLTAFCADRGVLRLECGSGGGPRKQRQSQRMRLLDRVLKEDVSTLSPEELAAHHFPAMLLDDESELELQHHADAFSEVASCDSVGWKVLQPEDGLIYAACLPECPAEELARAITHTGRGWRDYTVACFRNRIVGDYSWVPPITTFNIPVEQLVGLLERRFYFFVFINVDYVRRQLAKLSPSISVSEHGGYIRFESSKEDWYVIRGPRPIENVQYGLLALKNALHLLAMEPQFDPAALVRERGTPDN